MIRFGLDAPREFALSVVGTLVLFALAVVWTPALHLGIAAAVYALAQLWVSLVGKRLMAARMMNGIPWRGDERVLDVGCGHGLLMIAAAKRLTTGTAVGVDVWSQKDQWRNSAAATLETARAAGVADRVEVHDADARSLPFEDATFDVIVSSIVIHNIPSDDERAKAIREIARVLRPGGRVAIVDIANTSHYADELRAAGLTVRRELALPMILPTARLVMASAP